MPASVPARLLCETLGENRIFWAICGHPSGHPPGTPSWTTSGNPFLEPLPDAGFLLLPSRSKNQIYWAICGQADTASWCTRPGEKWARDKRGFPILRVSTPVAMLHSHTMPTMAPLLVGPFLYVKNIGFLKGRNVANTGKEARPLAT